jgi:hypothetical protein
LAPQGRVSLIHLETNNRPRIKSWRPGRSTVLDWAQRWQPWRGPRRGALLQAAPRLLKSWAATCVRLLKGEAQFGFGLVVSWS